jgi:hypothetical protein
MKLDGEPPEWFLGMLDDGADTADVVVFVGISVSGVSDPDDEFARNLVEALKEVLYNPDAVAKVIRCGSGIAATVNKALHDTFGPDGEYPSELSTESWGLTGAEFGVRIREVAEQIAKGR